MVCGFVIGKAGVHICGAAQFWVRSRGFVFWPAAAQWYLQLRLSLDKDNAPPCHPIAPAAVPSKKTETILKQAGHHAMYTTASIINRMRNIESVLYKDSSATGRPNCMGTVSCSAADLL